MIEKKVTTVYAGRFEINQRVGLMSSILHPWTVWTKRPKKQENFLCIADTNNNNIIMVFELDKKGVRTLAIEDRWTFVCALTINCLNF